MATATLYLYNEPSQNYNISCWADRTFSRGPATVRKTSNNPSTSVGTIITEGTITAGSLTAMPNSNQQTLIFSYASLSKFKVDIKNITLYATLASDTTFDSLTVGEQLYTYPVYNTEYSGSIGLNNVNSLEKTITATISIDPYLSEEVMYALGGGSSWSVAKEATPTEDVFQQQDTVSTYIFKRYYRAATGIQRTWLSAKVTNVYLVIDYEEDTSIILDRTTAISALNIGIAGKAKKITDWFVGVEGKAKKITDAWIGVNGIAKKIYPVYTVGMLKPGDIIQIDESGLEEYTEWVVMHHNYYENNQTILMRKYCLQTPSSLDYEGGSGQYSYPYFDKTADNYLKDEWLNLKAETFKNLLIDTTIIGRTWLGSTNNSASRKIWLPSAVNLSASAFEDGSTAYQDDLNGVFDYFATNDSVIARMAYFEEDGTSVRWWTRTTVGGTHPYQRTIDKNGDFSSYQYYYSAYLRPVINISSNNYLEKISDNIYRIVI